MVVGHFGDASFVPLSGLICQLIFGTEVSIYIVPPLLVMVIQSHRFSRRRLFFLRPIIGCSILRHSFESDSPDPAKFP